MPLQTLQPVRLCTKDKALKHRSLYRGGRTFQVAYYDGGLPEERVYAFREKTIHTSALPDARSHATIKQHIARKDDAQRIAGKDSHRNRPQTKQANNPSYKIPLRCHSASP